MTCGARLSRSARGAFGARIRRRPRMDRTCGRPGARAPPRRRVGRRHQLVARGRGPRDALPGARDRPARPRQRPAGRGRVPPGGLRRRRRRRAAHPRHRPGHPGRVLDRRHGRPAAVAQAPRPGGGPGPVLHRPQRHRLAGGAGAGDGDAVGRGHRVVVRPVLAGGHRRHRRSAARRQPHAPHSAAPRSPTCAGCRWPPRSTPCARRARSAPTCGSAGSTCPPRCSSPATTASSRRSVSASWPRRCPTPWWWRSTATTACSSPTPQASPRGSSRRVPPSPCRLHPRRAPRPEGRTERRFRRLRGPTRMDGSATQLWRDHPSRPTPEVCPCPEHPPPTPVTPSSTTAARPPSSGTAA